MQSVWMQVIGQFDRKIQRDSDTQQMGQFSGERIGTNFAVLAFPLPNELASQFYTDPDQRQQMPSGRPELCTAIHAQYLSCYI